jgi:uncharacterized repeat protein (TIGR01451 family)
MGNGGGDYILVANQQESAHGRRPMPSGMHRMCFTAGALAVAMFATPALASGVQAGTMIHNVASASFDDGGGTKTITSNAVDLRVDEVLDVTVVAKDAGDASVNAGATSQVRAFTVTNAGNGPEVFALTAIGTVSGNDFNPAIAAIAVDTNGNGIYDAGVDQLVAANGVSPSLNPDTAITVFVISTIPTSAADGKRGEVKLTATAETGTGTPGTVFATKGSGGGDAIVGATHAQASAAEGFVIHAATLTLVKSATVTDPYGGTRAVPGSLITYQLVATVAGSGALTALHVTDPIPTGTTYQAGTLKLDGTALSDPADADAGTASSSGIDVSLGNQAAGAAHTVIFTVKIN